MKDKIKYPRLHSAISMIKRMRETFKNDKDTFKTIIKRFFYDDYDVDFLFPKLKPYFLGNKRENYLPQEDFVVPEGMKINEFSKMKKREKQKEKMDASFEKGGGRTTRWMD